MGAIASQITSLTIVYSTVYSGADQIKHESSASLAFVQGIHRWKMVPFDDVIIMVKQVFESWIVTVSNHPFTLKFKQTYQQNQMP